MKTLLLVLVMLVGCGNKETEKVVKVERVFVNKVVRITPTKFGYYIMFDNGHIIGFKQHSLVLVKVGDVLEYRKTDTEHYVSSVVSVDKNKKELK